MSSSEPDLNDFTTKTKTQNWVRQMGRYRPIIQDRGNIEHIGRIVGIAELWRCQETNEFEWRLVETIGLSEVKPR